MELLELRKLVFESGDRRILDGLELGIREAEIHALVGANGTGKSTLAYLVMGCEGYRPNAGEISFAGQRIDALPLHQRARLGIALAWQEPVRFEGITVRDYLSLGPAHADAAQYLYQVGLEPREYLDRMADKTLSGGERKRIELASVLALQPRLTILDEPTAGIDVLSVDDIMECIRSFKRHGGSVLLITHQQEVVHLADRASQLCGGRIVCTGDPDEVAAHYAARICVRCDGEVCGNE